MALKDQYPQLEGISDEAVAKAISLLTVLKAKRFTAVVLGVIGVSLLIAVGYCLLK